MKCDLPQCQSVGGSCSKNSSISVDISISSIINSSIKGRDSVVDIATPYGLDGWGIESRWCRYFPHLSIPVDAAHPAFYTVGTGFLSWGYSGRVVAIITYPV
jgi:hypothetical protein